MSSGNLTRYAWISVWAAVTTIVLKGAAYAMTASVGLLSDAVESLVNLAAALIAVWMLWLAARPADEEHAWGHTKAEYFSSSVEGALILLAAVGIVWSAVDRLLHPRAIENLGVGLLVSAVAAIVNLVTARVLLRKGREARSITLEADARHLMTDVWTSAGVIAAVGAVAMTGWQVLDPLIAIAVAINIVWSGVHLLMRSAHGLLDVGLPQSEQAVLRGVLESYRKRGFDFHAIRTRQSGSRSFISFHVLVPPEWTVKEGHDLLEEIERDVRGAIAGAHVSTHIEPLGDPASDADQGIDRT